eukprot:490135_1
MKPMLDETLPIGEFSRVSTQYIRIAVGASNPLLPPYELRPTPPYYSPHLIAVCVILWKPPPPLPLKPPRPPSPPLSLSAPPHVNAFLSNMPSIVFILPKQCITLGKVSFLTFSSFTFI